MLGILANCSRALLAAGTGLLSSSVGVAFTIYSDDLAPPPVYLSSHAAPDTRRAAEDLARVLSLASGKHTEVRVEPLVSGTRGIYVGRTRRAGVLRARLPLPDRDTVLMHVDAESLLLLGSDDAGHALAVYRFIQREQAAYWLMPGRLGEVIPRRAQWVVQGDGFCETPAFLSREYHIPQPTPEERRWLECNLMRPRWEFNHNTYRLLSASDYEGNPEWFPVIAGTPYRPSGPRDHNWQPNLLSESFRERSAQRAREHFWRHPDAPSFSIGIMDSTNFGESAAYEALLQGAGSFRGRPDYSPLVFDYSRAVAERLYRTNPGRLLGCLAYLWWEQPPPFPLPRNLVPYIATDRSQWYDPVRRLEGERLIQRWAQTGVEHFGLYDYYYGYPFVIPRPLRQTIAASIPFAAEQGATGFFAEIRPVWVYDGAKAWVAARLLWDPEQHADNLYDRYFELFYGAAAPDIRAFFSLAEEAWMTQEGPAYWLKYYGDLRQVELLDGKTERMSGLLQQALDRAATERIRARVAELHRFFEFTQLARELQHAVNRLDELDPSAADDAKQVLAAVQEVSRLRREVRRREQVLLRTKGNARWPERITFPYRDDPRARQLIGLWRSGQSGASREQLLQALYRCYPAEAPAWRLAANLPEARNLLVNSSLEIPLLPPGPPRSEHPSPWERELAIPQHWGGHVREFEGAEIRRTSQAALSGRYGVRFIGAEITLFGQMVQVQPRTTYYLTCHVRGEVNRTCRVALNAEWYDAHGKSLGQSYSDRLAEGSHAEWRDLGVLARAPNGVRWARITLEVRYQDRGSVIDVDDFRLIAIEPPLPRP